MKYFSERNNLITDKEIQVNTVDISLFNRLFNILYKREYATDGFDLFHNSIGMVEILLDSFGHRYDFPTRSKIANKNLDDLHALVFNSEWYVIYDLMEKYVQYTSSTNEKNDLMEEINLVLEEEKAGYRMLKGTITPIINIEELKSLEKSLSSEFDTINKHFEKALKYYSQRANPDYENSIKESISAVEAMCCIINGKDSTLNDAIKKLTDNGIHIHKAMEKGFISLYSYTCDEKGIRHAGIDFVNASSEDAKYMLISCSSFVNYLIEKFNKIQDI